MNGYELMNDIQDSLDHCAECVGAMFELGKKRAEAEREYRIAKRQRVLYERTHNKTPVTLISDTVKGFRDIADLKFNLDCADAEYEANHEAVLYWKKRVDTLREVAKREWTQAGEPNAY